MSHFSRIKTQMVVKEYITKALDDLGYQYQEGNQEIRGYGGKRTQVEIMLPTTNPGYDIGFVKSGNAYELVADWWGIRNIDKTQFQNQVVQRYAYHAALDQLGQQGFNLVNEEKQADGKIHLVLRRMA